MKTTEQIAETYVAPAIRIVEVRVEKGFAGSFDGYGSDSDDSEFRG